MSNVTIFGGGAFGMILDQEDGALINGFLTLLKETLGSFLALSVL